MVEVFGDSARGDELAFVRLVVDGDRIVEAHAPGMARPLAGLTLLEAAPSPARPSPPTRLRTLAQAFRADPIPSGSRSR